VRLHSSLQDMAAAAMLHGTATLLLLFVEY
jgi:hypothetical protein